MKLPSKIAVDRPQTVRRPKVGPTIGRIDNDVVLAIQHALAVFLGLA